MADTRAETHRPRLRILVAEDDQEMRRLVVDALRKDGHDVVEAGDGRELLIQVTAASKPPGPQFDAVISDIRRSAAVSRSSKFCARRNGRCP